MSAQPRQEGTPAALRHPSLLALASGFVSLALRGFGGMAAHAHYFFVIERKWLDESEFTELYGICQALPGPNVVGMSIVIGDRSYGPLGSLVCASALAVPPTILAIALTVLIQFVAFHPVTIAIERGVVWGAAGLMIATGLRALIGTARSRPAAETVRTLLFTAVTVVLVIGGIVALPLVVVAMTAVAFFFERRPAREAGPA